MDELRRNVKEIKAFQGVSYKELAEYLEIKQSSFYSWLNGQFELSYYKKQRLQEIIDTIKE